VIWLPEKTYSVKYDISIEYKYNHIRYHLEIKAFLTRQGFPCLLFGFLRSDFSYLLSFKCILRTIVCTDILNLRFCFWQQLLSLKIINLIEVMSGRELRMLGVLSCGQVTWFLCRELTTLDGSIIDNMFLVHFVQDTMGLVWNLVCINLSLVEDEVLSFFMMTSEVCARFCWHNNMHEVLSSGWSIRF